MVHHEQDRPSASNQSLDPDLDLVFDIIPQKPVDGMRLELVQQESCSLTTKVKTYRISLSLSLGHSLKLVMSLLFGIFF
ncbi:MAG: hypothetical protein RLZZ511_4065 [Cyanobacteriota bacterium]|jgi:hypothetical protein